MGPLNLDLPGQRIRKEEYKQAFDTNLRHFWHFQCHWTLQTVSTKKVLTFNTQLHLQDEPYKRKTETVRDKKKITRMCLSCLCALCHSICVRRCSCPPFQESGTRPNLTWPPVSGGVWPKTCIHTRTCMHRPQRNRATGHTLFPRPAERKEVRAGGHTARQR